MKLLEEVSTLKPGFISITGGEPLLRRDLFSLFEYAGSLGMNVGMVTNGYFLGDDVAKMLSRLEVYVSLSFDAATKETCETLRGEGTWDRVMAAAERLRSNGVEFNPVMTLTSLNLGEAGEFVRLASTLGADHAALIPVIPSGNASKSLLPNPAHLALAIKDVENVADEAGFPVSLWCTPFAKAIVHSPYVYPGGCSNLSMDLDPVGNVLLCDVLDFKLGNILEDGGKVAWQKMRSSQLYRSLCDPSRLSGKCAACKFRDVCMGGCRARAYLTTGSFFNPDPLCPM
nr:radical SAM protein [Candidatus Bathyarchaeota archaeon]